MGYRDMIFMNKGFWKDIFKIIWICWNTNEVSDALPFLDLSINYNIFFWHDLWNNIWIGWMIFCYSVAPWIDFDNYIVFEGITNDFGLKKDLLHYRGKIIILSRPNLEASRARTKDMQSIEGNFNIFGSIFCKKIRFLFLSRPHESTHG